MSEKCKAAVFQIRPIDGSAQVNVGPVRYGEKWPNVRMPMVSIELPVHISAQPTDKFLRELEDVALRAVNWDVIDQWATKMQGLALENTEKSSD